MSVHASVQDAHDALLAKPEVSAVHAPCPLCTAGTHHSAKEGASVSDTTAAAVAANVYTEAQHFALLESAIARETAQLADEKGALQAQVETLSSEKATMATELDGAKNRLDVLEAEKAAAEARAEAAVKEFEDFKAEMARKAEVAEKKTARVERVKAANSALGEGYFTEERAARWAEMSDEAFDALIADLVEAAAAVKPAELASEKPATELARESAAFKGGETASATEGETALSSFLGVRMRRGGVTA